MDNENLLTGKLAVNARSFADKVQVNFIPYSVDGQFEVIPLVMPVDMLYVWDGNDYRPATEDDKLVADMAVAVDKATLEANIRRMIKTQQKYKETSK